MKKILILLLAVAVGPAFADSPPSTPGNPVANVYSATSGAVRWQRSTDDRLVVGYELSRDGQRLGTFDALSYVERDLEPGRSYRYTIVALDTAGQRSGAAQVSLVTPDATPSAPDGLRADVYSRTTAELFWDRSGVFGERYVIKRDGQEVGTTDGTTYIDRTLTTARPYLFEVIALNRQGRRSASTRLFVSTAPDGDSTDPTPSDPPLAAPAGLRSSVYSKTAAELFWTRPDTFGLRYEVRRDGTLLTTTDGVGYYDNQLEAGRSYTYEITAIAPDGRRSGVSSLTLSTPGGTDTPPTLAAPANLRADVYSRTSAELFWDRPATPGLRYEVSRDGTVLGTTDGTGYYENTLSSGTRYLYEIVAIGRDGSRSAPSSIAVLTDGDDASTPPPTAGGPSAPAELSVDINSERRVRLEWRRGPDELDLSYEIRRDGSVVNTVGPSTGFVFGFSTNTLVPGTDYVFEVIAIDPEGRRSAPSSIEVRTEGETPSPESAPPAPSNLRVEIYASAPGEPRQAALFWDQSATPGLRYEVQRNGFVFETTRQTSYYFESFAGGTDFTFDIVAFEGERQSPPARVSVSLPPRTPLPERSDEPDALDLASDSLTAERGLVVTPSSFGADALGDVDGDALADLLFFEREGEANILPGRARGDLELDPRETSTTGGYRVPGSAGRARARGDFNGDGVADLIGAEPTETVDGSTRAGRVWVLYGQRGGLADYESFDDIGPGEGAVFSGFAPDQEIGSVVSGIGDVDGDGFDDFAMLADPTFFPDRGGPGGIYVVYGSDALPASLPLGQIDSVGELISAPEIDAFNEDFVYSAQIAGFVPIGDHNGDGLDDLAILYTAEPRESFNDPLVRRNQGTLLVLYGRAGRRLELPTVTDPIAPERGYRLTDAPQYSTIIPVRGSFFGAGVLGAGDVNGDGSDDILVQGYGLVLGTTETSPPAASTIDDLPAARKRPISGLVDIEVRRNLYPIGDVDGNGQADLYIGDGRVRAAEDEVGYVILDAFATADPLSLKNLRDQPGFPLLSADGRRGTAVAIGDFDGDGLDDFHVLQAVSPNAGAIIYGSRNFR